MRTAESTVDELDRSQDPEIARSIDLDVVQTAPKSKRLLSIDVLRGLTIAFMILVNNQSGPNPFWALHHAAWNGFTPTDLVFPTFLLLVGLSLVLSTAARRARGVPRFTLFLHILRRSAVLCLFGIIVNTFPFLHLDHIRYYGVLQRTGICYLVVGTLYLFLPGWKDKVVLAVVCLAGYWALMRFVPVPGFGVPTHDIAINDMNGNLTAYVDRLLFAPQHLYEKVRDPEGLLSTIPAFATAIFGLLAGIWLRTSRSTRDKAIGLAACGFAFVLGGALWNPFFPVNKKLWTSSFVLFAGGFSLLLLALAIYITDIKRLGRQDVTRADAPEHPTLYKPLLVFGTNSIAAYMVSELLDPIMHFIHTPDGDIGKTYTLWLHRVLPIYGVPELLFGLTIVLITWLAVLPLYRKRIFLRI
jgi:predicted acyltransferase